MTTDIEEKSPFHPMVFCLIAAILGILTDYYSNVEIVVWKTALFSILVVLLFFWFFPKVVPAIAKRGFFGWRRLRGDSFSSDVQERGGWIGNFVSCFGRFFDFVFKRSFGFAFGRLFYSASFWTFCLIFCFFGCWRSLYWNCYSSDEIGFLIDKRNSPAIVEGCVLTSPRLYEATDREFGQIFEPSPSTIFLLKVEKIMNRGAWRKTSGKVQVVVRADACFLKTGDFIRIEGELNPLKTPDNPVDYNQEFQLRSRRILTTMSVPLIESIERISVRRRFELDRFFERMRETAAKTFENELSPKNAQIADAIALGIRNSLDDETTDLFRETGTIHFLAISGLHLALFSKIVYSVLLIFGCPRRCSSIVLTGAIVFYLFLTGFQTPSVRAAVLIIIVCGGLLFQRISFNVNSLAAAAVVILAANPNELFQLGTQLSFLATGVFLWFAQDSTSIDDSEADKTETLWSKIGAKIELTFQLIRLRFLYLIRYDYINELTQVYFQSIILAGFDRSQNKGNRNEKRSSFEAFCRRFPVDVWAARTALFLIAATKKTTRRFWRLTITSLAIWLVLTPIVLQNFNIAAPISVVVNPIIWIPMLFSLLGCMILAFCSWTCPFFCSWSGALTEASLNVFRFLLETGRSISGGNVWLPGPSPFWNFGFYLPLVFWTLFPARRPRLLTLVVFVLIWAFLGCGVRYINACRDQSRGRVRVQFFAVGHGASILITTPERRNVLYDCGSLTVSPKNLARTISKSIWSQGKREIDLLIFSHADADHYNAFFELSDRLKIKAIAVSPTMFHKNDDFVEQLKRRIEASDVPLYFVSNGDRFDFVGFPSISVLHPNAADGETLSAEELEEAAEQTNENSVVLLLEYWGRRILLSGDLDATAADFVQTPTEKIDVLSAPHHGGKSQNYRELLDWGRPSTIVISGGRFQRNLASEESLRAEGFQVLNTYSNGCVAVELTKGDDSGSARGKIEIRPTRDRFVQDYFDVSSEKINSP